jgi:Rieske Fe-S protein
MILKRRDFLLLSTGFVASCSSTKNGGVQGAREERVVNAGRASDYAADGVYPQFRDQGFFIIRNGDKLFALAAICTHRKCKLLEEPDRSFYCKCHGSTFDPTGQVTKGPARRDLRVFPTSTDGRGQLLVRVPV